MFLAKVLLAEALFQAILLKNAKETRPLGVFLARRASGLGWRRKGHTGYQWAFSPITNAATVGHTGWTGTLTVIDPYNNASLVLLTNTKNSPVIDNQTNPNDFVGNHFLTGGLRRYFYTGL